MTPDQLHLVSQIAARFSTLDLIIVIGMVLCYRIVVTEKKTNRSNDRFALYIIGASVLIAAVFRAAIWIKG